MPIVEGVVDALGAVDDDVARTLASFGYEWTTFDTIQPEDETFWRDYYFVDVPLDELEGRVGLDAGCGKGRYSRFTAEHLAALVALDGSDAVQAAARNLGELDNVVVVRGDILRLPLAERSFGFVSCLGVLHHLPDPRAGFRSLTRVLEPGGILFLYVYSRGRGLRAAGLAVAARLRQATVWLPHPLLRVLSAPLAAVLYLTLVLPGRAGDQFGRPRLRALPLSVYRGRPLRALWLDTFDRLSAPIEHRYVWDELEPWFREAGLDVLSVREDAGLFIRARLPDVARHVS